MSLISLTAVCRPTFRPKHRRWHRVNGLGKIEWRKGVKERPDTHFVVCRLYHCRLCGRIHTDESDILPLSANFEPQVCERCWVWRYQKTFGGLVKDTKRKIYWRRFWEQLNLYATAKMYLAEYEKYRAGLVWRDGMWRVPLKGERAKT